MKHLFALLNNNYFFFHHRKTIPMLLSRSLFDKLRISREFLEREIKTGENTVKKILQTVRTLSIMINNEDFFLSDFQIKSKR